MALLPHIPHIDLEALNYAVEWAIRIGALAVVPLRRNPAATRGWLLLIFFLPIPGLLLFWAIGSPRFPAWRAERFRALRPFLDDVTHRLGAEAGASSGGAIADLACTLGRMPPVGGNSAELIDDYDAVIDRLVADIEAARTSVRILVYIFADDAPGIRVIEALGRAQARGIATQVMIDPVGSHTWRRGTMRRLAAANVPVRAANPFRLLRRRTRRDMRNHRKLFVIDGAIGYTGSQNIVAKDFRPGVVNRELVVRVTGPIVAEMEAVVRGDWYIETEALPEAPVVIPAAAGDACLQLLPSGADYPLEGFQTLLVWQLHQATERVIMVTPYFIPDEDVLGAMRSAVARKVRVDVIVSKVVDQRLVNLAQCSFYDELLAAGVRIHRFRDELLHAKSVSVDGRLAVVGSSNVDLRSFQLNEEGSLLLYDADSIARVGGDPAWLYRVERPARAGRVAQALGRPQAARECRPAGEPLALTTGRRRAFDSARTVILDCGFLGRGGWAWARSRGAISSTASPSGSARSRRGGCPPRRWPRHPPPPPIRRCAPACADRIPARSSRRTSCAMAAIPAPARSTIRARPTISSWSAAASAGSRRRTLSARRCLRPGS